MKSWFFVSALFLSLNALAAPAESFSEAAFKEASASGKPFVVAFHSSSCGSCKVQKPSLESALLEPELKEVRGLMANFEATSDFRKGLEKVVRGPSTILVFKGGNEVARIQGETSKEKIQELIARAIL